MNPYPMAEKMTAVWLILLTIIACAAIPAIMIWLTTTPTPSKPHLILGIVEFLPSANFSIINRTSYFWSMIFIFQHISCFSIICF